MYGDVVSRYEQGLDPHHRPAPAARAVVAHANTIVAQDSAHRGRNPPRRQTAAATSPIPTNQGTNRHGTRPSSASQPSMNHGVDAGSDARAPTRIHAIVAKQTTCSALFHARRPRRNRPAKGSNASPIAGIRNRESTLTGEANQ